MLIFVFLNKKKHLKKSKICECKLKITIDKKSTVFNFVVHFHKYLYIFLKLSKKKFWQYFLVISFRLYITDNLLILLIINL